MWGPSIIGFGTYHYKYDSGREGDMPRAAFSPRKPNLVIYLLGVFDTQPHLMAKLGTYKSSKGCLYVKRLSDIDMDVLEELVRADMACETVWCWAEYRKHEEATSADIANPKH